MSVLRVLALAIILAACPAQAAAEEDWVRPAVLAGTWYPAQAEALARSVDAYLAGGQKEAGGRVIALVVPHAGYLYSGGVAGAGWAVAARMSPPPQTVVLLGPSHRVALDRPSIWPRGAYDCPLGRVEIDADLAADLSRRLAAQFDRRAHLSEHCLEIQLPFLIRALPQAKLVPVLTGQPDFLQARLLGQALTEAITGRSVLLVASTDLSHFHPEEVARQMDGQLAERIEGLDVEGLMADAAAGRVEACGLQALLGVLWAARLAGANQGLILARATSAQVTGDRGEVVGYLAAALTAIDGPTEAETKGRSSILDEHRRLLLRDLARRSIEAAVLGLKPPSPPTDDPVLANPAGVFVTLRLNGALRGCIGTLGGQMALGAAVVEMAAAAACRDPRFKPVQPDELGELELEISVLTPIKPIRPEEVRLGIDGLIINLDQHSGLLLPQVPLELGWDRVQFLDGLCQKAGLPAKAWRHPQAQLFAFQAEVF